jgi:hypothetical protein
MNCSGKIDEIVYSLIALIFVMLLFYVCHKLNGKNTILHDDG